MADLPSGQALFEIGAAEVRAVDPRIDPAQIDVEGSDINIVLAAARAMAEEVLRQGTIRFGNLLIDNATDDALDRLVFDRYRIERIGATSAVGAVQFTRPTAGAGAGTILAGFRIGSSDGVEYETTQDASFAALDLSSAPASVRVRAVIAGAATQVAAGALTVARSAIFDPTIVLTNAEPTAGGVDRETNERLRSRAHDLFLNARRGVLGAIEFGARSVSGVTFAVAVEAVDEFARPARFVDLYAADPSGTMNATLADLVRTTLREYRAAGIYVRVNTVVPTFVSISLRLSFDAGIDTITATARVRAAVVNTVNTLPPNATLRVSAITEAIRTVDGVIAATDGAGASGGVLGPVGDLVPPAGQTIRTTLDRVTVE